MLIHPIADRMAKAVIDGFEPEHIKVNNSKLVMGGMSAFLKQFAYCFDELIAIWQPGQGIVVGGVPIFFPASLKREAAPFKLLDIVSELGYMLFGKHRLF